MNDNNMKTIGTYKKKVDKPFLAARIPASLSEALEAHVKSTEESKTDVIINALSVYLGWSDNGATQINASDRLGRLEARLDELEKLVREPRQISLLDSPEKPRVEEFHNPKSVIKSDNRNNKEAEAVLSTREISELSGMKYEAVRSRHRAERIIMIGDKSYRPFKRGTACLWDPN